MDDRDGWRKRERERERGREGQGMYCYHDLMMMMMMMMMIRKLSVCSTAYEQRTKAKRIYLIMGVKDSSQRITS